MTGIAVTQLRMCREYGGAERYVVDLCGRLNERGYRANLIAPPDSPFAELAEQIPVPLVKLSIRGDFNLRVPNMVARVLRSFGTQIFNMHDGTVPCCLGARLAGIPAVATIHGFRHKWNYLAADHLITVSDAVRQHLLARGVPARRMTVVRNGVDTRYFTPADRLAAQQMLGLDPEAWYFAVTGRLIPKKGIDLLLTAFAGVVEAFPAARLLVSGAGASEGALRMQTAQLGLTPRVHFLGFQRDVRPVLAAAHCHVLPSRIEPLGLAELEAMACGRPSIVTNSGGPAEVVRDRETGIIIEPGRVDQLREALLFVLRHPTWAREAGPAARAWTEAEHTLDKQVDEIEAVYDRLLASRHID